MRMIALGVRNLWRNKLRLVVVALLIGLPGALLLTPRATDAGEGRRDPLLPVPSAVAFVIVFPAFIVAPLLPPLGGRIRDIHGEEGDIDTERDTTDPGTAARAGHQPAAR